MKLTGMPTALSVLIASTLFADVPSHPSEIIFPEYAFTPPSASEYRHELSNGIPVYIAEDKELPLINISLIFLGGDYLDPADQSGLVDMMATLVRAGGTTTMSAEEVDEQFDFLAANASTRSGGITTIASLNTLSSNLDESLPLFIDMVQSPGFQDSRLTLARDEFIEGMKQRNDHPQSILSRERAMLMYGYSWRGRQATESSVSSVTKADLTKAHTMIFNPANLIIAVSGDFDEEKMLKTLDNALASWPKGARVSAPPETPSGYTPAIYYVDQDVPQGGVMMGLRSIRRDDPDLAAAEIMNDILGGGGFSSRITKRVRSDEGLAYSAGSRLSPGTWDDGAWQASFQSKNPTVALAIDLILTEMAGIRDGEVTDEEMDVAKGSIIETFPATFQSKHGTVSVFASDELTGRDPGFWAGWRDRVRAVTKADVRRVANRLLNDDALVIVIVGDWGNIDAGDADGRASMSAVSDRLDFAVMELPLRDPLTMEPLQ